MAVTYSRFRCPLELVLTPNILICVWKETWIHTILLELRTLKFVENREISRFLQFLRFCPFLRIFDSESIASIQVSLRTHVNVFDVNTSSKGHLNRAKFKATVAV